MFNQNLWKNFFLKLIKKCKLCLYLNCSPNSSATLGVISKMPLLGWEWPPYAYSIRKIFILFKFLLYGLYFIYIKHLPVPYISTPEWNTPRPIGVVYSFIQYCNHITFLKLNTTKNNILLLLLIFYEYYHAFHLNFIKHFENK